MIEVSQSRIKLWRKCRRAEYYKWHERLRAKKVSRPLKFGTLVHRMLEHNCNGDDWRNAITELSMEDLNLFENEKAEYGDIINDASFIMRGYLERWKSEPLQYLRWDGKYAEHKLAIKLTPSIKLTGKVDFIARTRNKRRWLADHKTGKKSLSDTQMWRNVQSTVYHRLWEELGQKPLDGTLWDIILSKAPTRPSFTKLGKVSRAAMVTLPVVVREFIKANKRKIKPADEEYLLEVAAEGPARYYNRVFMPRDPSVEKMLIEDFTTSAKEIEKRSGKSKTRNLDWHCDSCEYNKLCQARLLKLDYGFVKRNQYYVEPEEGVEGGDEEED